MIHWRVVSLVLLAGFVTAASFAKEGDPTGGKLIYTKKCAACHGKQGEGKPAIAKMLKVELRHLGSKEVQAKSDADLRKDTVKGKGKMKPVKGLSDEDVASVIAYLRSLKQK